MAVMNPRIEELRRKRKKEEAELEEESRMRRFLQPASQIKIVEIGPPEVDKENPPHDSTSRRGLVTSVS